MRAGTRFGILTSDLRGVHIATVRTVCRTNDLPKASSPAERGSCKGKPKETQAELQSQTCRWTPLFYLVTHDIGPQNRLQGSTPRFVCFGKPTENPPTCIMSCKRCIGT